jgi:hypothetical protein
LEGAGLHGGADHVQQANISGISLADLLVAQDHGQQVHSSY